MNYKLVLFDRDGTLNVRIKSGYVLSEHQLIFPSDISFLRKLSAKMVAIVTNQACVNKGFVSHSRVQEITSSLAQFFNESIELAIFICPHDESSGCVCRKPRPFLLESAIEYFEVQKNEAVFIGDSKSDAEAALNAGIDFRAVCWDSVCWHENCLHTLENVAKFLNMEVSGK